MNLARLDTRQRIQAAAALAVLASLVLWLATGAGAANQYDVQVNGAGASKAGQPFNLTDLGMPDKTDATFNTTEGKVTVAAGYSLKNVLDQAAAKKSALDYSRAPFVEVDGKNGIHEVSPADYADPIFYKEGDTRYLLTPLGGGQWLRESFATTISIRIGKYDDFSVAVSRNPKSGEIDPGQQISFGTIIEDDEQGARYSFSWRFGDGATSKTKNSAKHSYKSPGKYQVEVVVTDNLGRSTTGLQLVQVGKPEKSKKNREGGGKDKNGSENGAVDGDSDPGSGSTYPYGTGYGDPGTGSTPSPGPSGRKNQPKQEDPPAQPVDDGLEEVAGELVSSQTPAGTVTAVAPPAGPEALRDGNPDAGGGLLSGGAMTALGIIALLALGLGFEYRGYRNR